MKILVNDHSGHAFPLHLSVELAKNNFEVLHSYSANFQSPKGDFDIEKNNVKGLTIFPIYYDSEFNKYSILKRRKQELEFADKLITKIKVFHPGVLICCNTPLFAQQKIQEYCLKNGIKFIFWCQDIYSIAIEKIFIKKLGFIGKTGGAYFKKMEKNQLKRSNHIVNITNDFNPLFNNWGILPEQITVIPNWAPLGNIPVKPKINNWSELFGLSDQFCITYSGTLGLKHNPLLIYELAKHFEANNQIKIVLISEGLGADLLLKKKNKENLKNLIILPFQDFTNLPYILGASDILLALLEPEAGIFSVPSKVLSYLCAGKPILLSVPATNLISKIVTDNNAGISVEPGNTDALITAAEKLYADEPLRELMGNNSRKYAETNFIIEKIASQFISIIGNTNNDE